MQKFGIIKNVFDQQQLNLWKDIYTKGQKILMSNGDPCWGIDKKSFSYAWCLKNLMPVIWKTFNQNEKLIYSAYKDVTSPFGIHQDLKPLPEGVFGKHSLSILIPFSVEHSIENLQKVGTCFYNNDHEIIECIFWKPTSIIWWKSEMWHSSSNFIKEGVQSKQFFITHTYV